jgi:hypothetical protein
VTHFLLTYRRSTAELLDLQDLGSDRSRALDLMFEAERAVRTDPDVEVVVLSAESAADLKRTHSRYFRTISQIVQDITETEPAA